MIRSIQHFGPRPETDPEDVYFALRVGGFSASAILLGCTCTLPATQALPAINATVAPFEVAKQFSVESVYYEKPFGLHRIGYGFPDLRRVRITALAAANSLILYVAQPHIRECVTQETGGGGGGGGVLTADILTAPRRTGVRNGHMPKNKTLGRAYTLLPPDRAVYRNAALGVTKREIKSRVRSTQGSPHSVGWNN
jgi:hypothetical protein